MKVFLDLFQDSKIDSFIFFSLELQNNLQNNNPAKMIPGITNNSRPIPIQKVEIKDKIKTF